MNRACIAALAAVLAPSASASTYTVDDDAPADFTDLPAAVAAAVPGDVLLVHGGSYSPFVLEEGLTLVGDGTAVVAGTCTVAHVPLGQRAVLVGLRPAALVVHDCSGSVVVQDLGTLNALSIAASRDVRLRIVNVAAPAGTSDAAVIASSRVEWVASTLRGGDGIAPGPRDGGAGLRILGGARVHFVRSSAFGGAGIDGVTPLELAGDGGTAVRIDDGDCICAGGAFATLAGGDGGVNASVADCSANGAGGPGFATLAGASVRYSEASISGAGATIAPSCAFVRGTAFAGGGLVTESVPADTILRGITNVVAGAPLVFTLRAPPGSTAVGRVGRSLALETTPGIEIENLVGLARTFPIPLVGASGEVEWGFVVPSTFPRGFVFVAQVDVTYPGGEVRRTNSIVNVVR